MTRRKATRQPVSSFGPQLLAVLLKGARERVDIPCPDQRTMKWLQFRIHTLRGAMDRDNHPQYTLACKARTSRTWPDPEHPDKDCVLVIQPQDHQFSDLLTAAGVPPDPHAQELLDDSGPALAGPFSLDDEISVAHDPYAKFKENQK